jgi:hypothetical protein
MSIMHPCPLPVAVRPPGTSMVAMVTMVATSQPGPSGPELMAGSGTALTRDGTVGQHLASRV